MCVPVELPLAQAELHTYVPAHDLCTGCVSTHVSVHHKFPSPSPIWNLVHSKNALMVVISKPHTSIIHTSNFPDLDAAMLTQGGIVFVAGEA